MAEQGVKFMSAGRAHQPHFVAFAPCTIFTTGLTLCSYNRHVRSGARCWVQSQIFAGVHFHWQPARLTLKPNRRRGGE
jgi:hypothetical protein